MKSTVETIMHKRNGLNCLMLTVITVFHLLLVLLFSFYSLISNKTCFIGYILKEIIKKKTLTVFTLKPVQGYVFPCV